MDELELRRKLKLAREKLSAKEFQFTADQFVTKLKTQGLINDQEEWMLRKMIMEKLDVDW